MSIKGIWEKFLDYMRLPEVPEDDWDENAESEPENTAVSENEDNNRSKQ